MYEAEDTHWWYRGMRGVMFTLLGLRRRGYAPTILDAGCGTGGTLHALREAGHGGAEGFDFSPIALHFCRQRGLENVRPGSVTDIPFPDDTFDIAISCDVITDAGTEDEERAIRELYRILKPGGRLFLNLPAFDFLRSEHDRATSVARRYRRGQIAAKLKRQGFRIRRNTYWNMFLFPVVVAVRLLRRERPEDLNEPARSDIAVPPEPVNTLLTLIMWVESLLVRYFDLPVGSSVAVVAVKPKRRHGTARQCSDVT